MILNMKKTFFPFLIILVLFSSVTFIPVVAQAQRDSNDTVTNPSPDSKDTVDNPNPNSKSDTVQINLKVDNPIGKIDSVDGLIAQLIKIALLIGVPLLVLAFIWIGFLFVKAQGNPTKIKEARDFLGWAIVGAFLLLGASVLAEAIRGTVDQLR